MWCGVVLPTSRWGVNQVREEKNRLLDFLINPPVNCRHLGGEPVVATDSLSITYYIFYFSIKKLNTKRLSMLYHRNPYFSTCRTKTLIASSSPEGPSLLSVVRRTLSIVTANNEQRGHGPSICTDNGVPEVDHRLEEHKHIKHKFN